MIWIVKGIKMHGSTLKKSQLEQQETDDHILCTHANLQWSFLHVNALLCLAHADYLKTVKSNYSIIFFYNIFTYSESDHRQKIKIFYFLSRENKNPRTLWLRQLLISWYKNKNKNAKQIHQFHDKPTLPTPSEWTKCIKSPSSYKSFAPWRLVRRKQKELPADLLPTQIKKILQPKNWDCIKCGHDEIEKLQHLDFAVRDQITREISNQKIVP